MRKKLTIELPEKSKTMKIKYADFALKLGGTIREINVDELYQKVGHPFVYSDALYSMQNHAPYLKDDLKLKNLEMNYFAKRFDQLGFTDISSFVICNMGSLGHGVFANRDFEPGECFILYSGIIVDSSQAEINSLYAFGYGKEMPLFVDAAEMGNITRFIQHMPLNFELYNHCNVEYHLNSSLINRESIEFWAWRNISYKSNLNENEVAWANLAMMIIPQEKVPCIILYNTRKIYKGDQLGIDYGVGYWIRRNLRPELFDLKGNVIPPTQYCYKEILIDLPLMELFNQFPQFQNVGTLRSYNASMFQQDLQRKQELMQPVWFSHLSEPVSIFELRELLLQHNTIGKEYESQENEFLVKLKNLLPSAFKIRMYTRDPHQQFTQTIYDVVCTTHDLMKWSQLAAIFKSPVFASTTLKTKCLKFTQEIIIMDVGTNLEDQVFLLTTIQLLKTQGYFNKALPDGLVPLGPTRKNQNGIVKATSEEAISQILLHNPGLTREEINNAYKLLEVLFNPIVPSDVKPGVQLNNSKEQKLNILTSTFFSNKAPSSWKAYPVDRLKGKYVGHQVHFFTIPVAFSQQARPFYQLLKQGGFEAELKQAHDKPSIVVDLTTSKINFTS